MDLGVLIALFGVLVAVPGAYVAIREWRRREPASLVIPAPDLMRQNPLRPDFWVFPPIEASSRKDILVVAGRILNAGPNDAFSVRIWAESEVSATEAEGALSTVFEEAVAPRNREADLEDLWQEFLGSYRNRGSYAPVLRVGEHLPFVVVAAYERPSSYIDGIRFGRPGAEWSRGWVEDGRQAHPVCASARNRGGDRLEFGPSDLCAPFEPQPGSPQRMSSRPD